MNETTWLIIIGLFFDIAGAYLIVSPLLNYVRKIKGKEFGQKVDYYEEKEFVRPNPAKEFRIQTRVRIGLALLAFGFFLQIVGNWYQNQPV